MFALGVTVYEALTGATPHPGDAAFERMAAIEAGRSVPLRKRRPDVPRAVARAIERALAVEPTARWPDGAAFAAALALASRERARGPAVVALVALALLLVVVALVGTGLLRPTAEAQPVVPAPAPASPPATATDAATPPPGGASSRPQALQAHEPRTLRRASTIGAGAWKLPGEVLSAVGSADGERALAGLHEGTVALVDATAGEVLWSTRLEDGPAVAVALRRDLTLGATCDREGRLQLWDLQSARPRGRVGLRKPASALAFSPDGRLLAAGGLDGTCRVVAVDGEQVIQMLRLGGRDGSSCVAWLDDEVLVTGSSHGELQAWQIDRGASLARMKADDEAIVGLRSGPGLVVAAGVKATSVWALARRGGGLSVSRRRTLRGAAATPAAARPSAVALDADGRYALLGGEDGRVLLQDATSGDIMASFRAGGAAIAVGLSADARRAWCLDREGRLHVRDVTAASGEALDRPAGHGGPVVGVALLGGGRAASASRDGTVRVWDLATGAEVLRCEHAGGVRAFAAARDGTRALSGSDAGDAALWDLALGERVARLDDQGGPVLAGSISAAGLVATGLGGGAVRAWAPGERALPLAGHRGEVTAVLALGAGGIVSGGVDGALRLWDLTMLSGHAELLGPGGPPIRALAPLQDGTVLSGDDAGLAAVWDLDDLTCARRLRHGGPVRAVSHAGPGRAATASADGTVRLWDLASGQELDRIDLSPGHDLPTALACSIDGRELLVGTARGVVVHYVAR